MRDNPLLTGLKIPRQPPPFTLVILGASGDLTARKLVPALYSLFSAGFLREFRIVGFARRDWSDQDFRRRVADMIEERSGEADLRRAFLQRVRFVSSTFEDRAGYRAIAGRHADPPNRLYYLASPPGTYDTIVDNLAATRMGGIARSNGGAGAFTRIVVEKPFGSDLASARELNRRLLGVFREDQVYRIDHYLGKETVQNVMTLRFGNGVYEPIWNSRYIDHVQITMAETLGVGTRGGYYEKAGALRDIVQNHLLQLLCLVAMEPPNDLNADSIRTEKVKVLKSIQPLSPARASTDAVRAQYGPGIVEGREVPGYRSEDGVRADSRTETYVALRLSLDSWRWSGVPFFLRTGKRLARRTTEIGVQFKLPPHIVFERLAVSPTLANTLVMRIQPDEGISLSFNAKVPGFGADMRPVNMDFSYGASFGDEPPEAYERLLLDALLGDATLYTRGDEVEAAWRFVDSVSASWAEGAPVEYPAGSSGPEEARRLIGEARRWRKL